MTSKHPTKPKKPTKSKLQKAAADGSKLTPETPKPVDDDPLTRVKKQVFVRMNASWLSTIIFAMVMLAGLAYSQWDKIRKLPGVPKAINYAREYLPIEKASGKRFAVGIALIDNDEQGLHRRILREALTNSLDIELLMINRLVEVEDSDRPQDAAAKGHEKSQKILKESGADLLVWGTAITDDPKGPLRMHWTLATGLSHSATYSPLGDTLDLPTLAQDDLPRLLAALVEFEQGRLQRSRGTDVAERAISLSKKLESLLAGTYGRGQEVPVLRTLLADAYWRYGDQRGDVAAMRKAIALATPSGDEEPLDPRDPLVNRRLGLRGIALFTLADKGPSSGSLKAFEESISTLQLLRGRLKEGSDDELIGNIMSTIGAAEVTLGDRRLDEKQIERGLEHLKATLPFLNPVSRAVAEDSIGQGLADLATIRETTGDPRLLDEAIGYFRSSLSRSTAAGAVLEAIKAQANLGLALAFRAKVPLGGPPNSASGLARAKEAVAVLQDVLAKQDRGRDPYAWAITKLNLGIALTVLGERTRDLQIITAAGQAITDARAVFIEHGQVHQAEGASLYLQRISTWTTGLQAELAETKAGPKPNQ